MTIVFIVLAFIVGVIVGIRWSYNDMEAANKRWKEYETNTKTAYSGTTYKPTKGTTTYTYTVPLSKPNPNPKNK